MECHLLRLIPVFMALSLGSCEHQMPIDSYCQVYNPVVVEKGDGSITGTPGVKKRILANELIYRNQCLTKAK